MNAAGPNSNPRFHGTISPCWHVSAHAVGPIAEGLPQRACHCDSDRAGNGHCKRQRHECEKLPHACLPLSERHKNCTASPRSHSHRARSMGRVDPLPNKETLCLSSPPASDEGGGDDAEDENGNLDDGPGTRGRYNVLRRVNPQGEERAS